MMMAKKILFFCCLLGGQLLAMESDRSQALERDSNAARGSVEARSFWGDVTATLGRWVGGADDDAGRLHNDIRAFLDRWGDGSRVEGLDLVGLQGVIGELESLKFNPYFESENPVLVAALTDLHKDLCRLKDIREKKLAAVDAQKPTGCVLL